MPSATLTELVTPLRSATLPVAVEYLHRRHAAKLDLVVPAASLRFNDDDATMTIAADQIAGAELIDGVWYVMNTEGFTRIPDRFEVAESFEDGLSTRLGFTPTQRNDGTIPRRMLREARTHVGATMAEIGAERPYALWSGLLTEAARFRSAKRVAEKGEERNFMVRAFVDSESGDGLARGFLSSRYLVADDLDGLTAILRGLVAAGIGEESASRATVSVGERKTVVKVPFPGISLDGGAMVDNYFDSRSGRSGHSTREVYPFLSFRNSEVGYGAWEIVQGVEMLVCTNGMTAERIHGRNHVGADLTPGVAWSSATHTNALNLLASQTTDAVAHALNVDTLRAQIDTLNAKWGAPMAEPMTVCKVVAKRMEFSERETNALLDAFMNGRQATVGGVVNALTWVAQDATPERAVTIEDSALAMLDVAYDARTMVLTK